MGKTAFDPATIAQMRAAISQINADLNDPTVSNSSIIADIAAYYNAQLAVRGYAKEAAEVVKDDGYNGAIANSNLEDYFLTQNAGLSGFDDFRTSVAASLVNEDWLIVQKDYSIPTLADVAEEHFTVFNDLGIPITRWSGTGYAARGINILGPDATQAELADLNPPDFVNMPTGQLVQADVDLLVAVAQNTVDPLTPGLPVNPSLITDPTYRQEFLNDLAITRDLGLNLLQAGISDLKIELNSYGITLGSDGSLEVDYQSLFGKLGQATVDGLDKLILEADQAGAPSESAFTFDRKGATATIGYSAAGDQKLVDLENDDGTSELTTYGSDGSSTATNYSGSNGTGEVTSQYIENSDGSSQFTSFSPDGSRTTTSRSSDGTVTGIDAENSDGTSALTSNSTYNSVKLSYPSPRGKGKPIGAEITLRSGVYNPAHPWEYDIDTAAEITIPQLSFSFAASREGTHVPTGRLPFYTGYFGNDLLPSIGTLSIGDSDYTKGISSDTISSGNSSGTIYLKPLSAGSGSYSAAQTVTVGLLNLNRSASAHVPIFETQRIYATAAAQVTGVNPGSTYYNNSTYYFHIGDPGDITVLISNISRGPLSDSLVLASVDPGYIVGATSLGVLGQGQSQAVHLKINTSSIKNEYTTDGSAVGIVGSEIIPLSFISHDSELPDVVVDPDTVIGHVNAVITELASPRLGISNSRYPFGVYSLADNETVLDFGNLVQGSTVADAQIIAYCVAKSAAEYALTDGYSATVEVRSGDGFSNHLSSNGENVYSAFDDIELGTVGVDTGSLGQHSEVIILHPTDSNKASGFTKQLSDRVLIIEDNVISASPVVTATPVEARVNASSKEGGVEIFLATAVDPVFGVIPVVFSEVLPDGMRKVVHSGDTFSLGVHTVVASATDPLGHTGAAVPFTFVVSDTSPPTVVASLRSTNTVATSLSGAVVYFDGSARDAVDGTTDPVVFTEQLDGGMTRTVRSGDTFAVGRHVIVASATDAAGNRGQAQPFNFTVTPDETTGVVEYSGAVALATVFADANGNGLLDSGEASTTTNGTGGFTLTGASGALIATGGLDIETGLPFMGSLEAPAGSAAITPVTTVLVGLLDVGVSNPVSVIDGSLGIPANTDLASLDAETGASEGDGVATTVFVTQTQLANVFSLIMGLGGNVPSKSAKAAVASAFESSASLLTDATQLAALAAGMGVNSANAAAIGAIGSAGNKLLATAAAHGTPTSALAITIAAIAQVVQGQAASSLMQANGDGSKLTSTVNAYTGESLINAVVQQGATRSLLDTGSVTEVGSGADQLDLLISEDAYQGDAKFTVAVDGQQVGGTLTATSAHGSSSDVVLVDGEWGPGDHTLTVDFVNDLYEGAATEDRNLFLDGAIYNGTPVAASQTSFYRNGSTSLIFDQMTTISGTTAIGSGPKQLIFKLREDAYAGDAEYTVSVDGRQIGGTQIASSAHGRASDTVLVNGNWATGDHTASVTFLNDLYGGTAANDRNLFLEGATYNGADVKGAQAALYRNGSAAFSFTDSTPPAHATTIGVGQSELMLDLSEDAYQGDAQFSVSVDGRQIGGLQTVLAPHGSEVDSLSIKGNWAPGEHAISIDFLNDKYGGSKAADRNLYLDQLLYNGVRVAGAQTAFYQSGMHDIIFHVPTNSV